MWPTTVRPTACVPGDLRAGRSQRRLGLRSQVGGVDREQHVGGDGHADLGRRRPRPHLAVDLLDVLLERDHGEPRDLALYQLGRRDGPRPGGVGVHDGDVVEPPRRGQQDVDRAAVRDGEGGVDDLDVLARGLLCGDGGRLPRG